MELDNTIYYPPVGNHLGDGDTSWTRFDGDSGSIHYYGYTLTLNADPSKPIWRIKKVDKSGSVHIVTFANGDGFYNNIWNDRASLIYK